MSINKEKSFKTLKQNKAVINSYNSTSIDGWKTVTMKFSKKCYVCQTTIRIGQKSMWHIQSGNNIHIVEECNLSI
jgi:hypothetical protein